MPRLTPIGLAALSAALFLAACETDEAPPVTHNRPVRGGIRPPPERVVVEDEPDRDRRSTVETRDDDSDARDARVEPRTTPQDASTAGTDAGAATAPKVGALEYGKKVDGKPGFVTSPYAGQHSGYVDVRGYPPGTEVRDPYTGRSFLVP